MFELLMQGLSEIGAAMASGANQSPSVGRPPPAKAPAPDAAPKPPADPEAMNVLYGEMYAGPAANDQDPMAAAEKANAKLAVDLMNIAVQHGEPNQDLIRAQLGMLSPQAREKALGQLDPKAREAATAVIEKDELAAEQATHLLKLATAGDQVEQRAAREAMERMPAWKRKEVLAQLTEEQRGAAGNALDQNEKQAAIAAQLEAGAAADERDVDAMARAFKDMPEDQREEIMRRLSGPARGATMDALHESEANAREAAAQKAEEIAKEIYVQRGGYIGSHGSPERFKGLMADLPLDQREAVLAAIPEEQREDAEAAMAMVVSDEALVQTSVALAETATIGGKPNPDVAKAVLDVVPLEQREAALAKMSEGARAAVEAEAAKRTAELEAASSALFKAVDDGDPNAMRKLLLNRGPQEIAELERIYGEQNLDENGKPRSLRGDLKEEFAEDIDEEAGERNDRDYIEAVFDGDKTTAKAIALQLAMEGTGSTDSTDEELIFATLESIKDPEERARVEAIFEERQSLDEDAVEDGTNTLTGMLRDELLEEDDASEAERDDYDYNRAMALHAGNFEKASAVKADQMLDPGIMGDLSIRDAMKGAMIVPGVGMAVAWAGPEVLELAGVDVDQKVAQPNVEGVAEMMADKPQAERDKIDAEMQGITGGAGLADVAAARCQNDYDVDLVDSAVKGDEVGVKAARWKKRAAGVNADEQGMMQQIEGPDHAKVMARIDEKYGEGTFNRLSNDVMNEEELKANQQLAETGEVDPVTGISAAAGRHALSWSLDDIGKHLRIKNGEHKGELHSADKMTEIKGELCAQWEVTEEELEEMIDEKMGGKDAFKLKQMLKGEPKDFHERMQRLRDEHDFTRGSGAGVIGSTVTDLSSDAGAAQDSQMAKLEGLYGTLADLDAKKADGGELTAEEQASYDKTMKEFTERSRYFGSNVSNYQAAQESITNDVTMVVGAVTAATVTIASAGTLGPAAAGVMGTLYAGAATMLTKEAMLGDSYNTHDQGKDAVNTAAQMGAGLATAGLAPAIGNAAGSVGGAVGNTLGATAGQVASAGFTGVANGAVSGLIGSTAAQLTDESVLQGKGDVGKIAGNIALGTAGSALGSGIAGASSVGLNHLGLQAAEAGKNFTQTSNLLNKQISGTLGELGSAALDPSVGDGKFFEKVAKKRALTGAGDLIGAVGDVKQARREEAAARMRAEAPPEIEAKLPPPEEEQAILKAADEGEAEGQAPAAKASSDDAAAPAETPWADAADTAGGWVGASANRQAENGAGPGELGGLKQLGDAFNVFTALFTDRKKISPKTLGKGATSLVGILAPMAADKILPGSGEFVGAMIDYGKDMLNSYLPDAADQLVGQGLGRILGLPSPGDDLPPARVPEPLDPNRVLPDLGPGPRSDVDEQLEKFQVGPKRRIEERPPEEPPGLGPLGPGPRSDVDEQLEKFQVGPKRRIAEEPAGEPARVRIAVTDEDERTRAAEIEDASEAEDQAPAEPTPVRPTSTNEEELAHEALEVMKRDLEIGDRRDFPKVDAEALGSATQKLAAKENLDPAETRALLDNAVAASRQLLVDENDRARPEHRVDDPFAPENLGGMCHPTQKSAARTLEDSGIDPENVVRRSINPGGEREHHFTVVTIGSETYLVDPTFAQFVQKQSPAGDVGREMIANGGTDLVEKLTVDGHIKLDEKTARIYGGALFGRDDVSLDDFLIQPEDEGKEPPL